MPKESVALEGGDKKCVQSFARKCLREVHLFFFKNPKFRWGDSNKTFFFQEYIGLKSCDSAYVEPLADSSKHGNNSSVYMKLREILAFFNDC